MTFVYSSFGQRWDLSGKIKNPTYSLHPDISVVENRLAHCLAPINFPFLQVGQVWPENWEVQWKSLHKLRKISQNCHRFRYAMPWESSISLIRGLNSDAALLCAWRLQRHLFPWQSPLWCLELFKIHIAYFMKLGFWFVWLTWWIVFWVLRSFKISQVFLLYLQLEWFDSQRYALY